MRVRLLPPEAYGLHEAGLKACEAKQGGAPMSPEMALRGDLPLSHGASAGKRGLWEAGLIANLREACRLSWGSTLELMPDTEIQYVSNENGEATAVIVPITLWREIESERETAYLLNSETMKRRLLEAKQRCDGLSLEVAAEKLGI